MFEETESGSRLKKEAELNKSDVSNGHVAFIYQLLITNHQTYAISNSFNLAALTTPLSQPRAV